MLAGIPSITATRELFMLSHFIPPLVKVLVIWALKRFKVFYHHPHPPILYVVTEMFHTYLPLWGLLLPTPPLQPSSPQLCYLILVYYFTVFKVLSQSLPYLTCTTSYDLFIVPVTTLFPSEDPEGYMSQGHDLAQEHTASKWQSWKRTDAQGIHGAQSPSIV